MLLTHKHNNTIATTRLQILTLLPNDPGSNESNKKNQIKQTDLSYKPFRPLTFRLELQRDTMGSNEFIARHAT